MGVGVAVSFLAGVRIGMYPRKKRGSLFYKICNSSFKIFSLFF